MRTRLLALMGLLVGLSPLALAQSGAPNLLQYHGRLVDPVTGQPITTPTQFRVQIIQGGTAEDNPSAGRVVFTEQAEVMPDENGRFDYLIGSHAPGVGTGRVRLDAEDFDTTHPVFVEIALVQPNGSAQVLLPRQRLGSVPYALQATDAAISTNATLTGTGTSEMPLGIADGGVGTQQLANNAVTAAKIAPGQVVKSLNGLFDNVTLVGAGPSITITPSGNTLTIAAPNALSSVAHNATLTGNGTGGMPLSVAVPLSLSGAVANPNSIITATNTNMGSGIGVRGVGGSDAGVFLALSVGVMGESGTGVGVLGSSDSSIGVNGRSSTGDGVFGNTSNGSKAGVHGFNNGSGPGVFGEGSPGVQGQSTSGSGVFGDSTSGHGVSGVSTSGRGVQGFSGSGPGVVGISSSTGNIFEGYGGITLRFRVRNDGQVRSDVGFTTPAADFAEMMEVEEARGPEANSYQPGDVLIISPETGKLRKCQQPYCTRVAGVYSTEPGFLGGQGIDEKRPGHQVPLALIGIVPCKVSAENGPIHFGDLLVTSSRLGHAMRGTDRSQMLGAIVGKALEPLPTGAGMIKVLVTLQ